MQTTASHSATIWHVRPPLPPRQAAAAQPHAQVQPAAPRFENLGDDPPNPVAHLALTIAPHAAQVRPYMPPTPGALALEAVPGVRPRPNICWEVTKIFLPAIFAAGALAGLLAYFQPDVDAG